MAQTQEIRVLEGNRVALAAQNLAVAITNVLGTVLELYNFHNVKRIWAMFALTVHDLNAFSVQVKFHADGAWITILSQSGDFTSPGGILVGASSDAGTPGASGDLTTLAASKTGWLGLDVVGLHGLRIQVSSASASGTLVDVNVGGGN